MSRRRRSYKRGGVGGGDEVDVIKSHTNHLHGMDKAQACGGQPRLRRRLSHERPDGIIRFFA